MANSKSALKRIQVAERNRLRNKSYRSAVKTLTKRYYTVLENYTANPAEDVQKAVDRNLSEAYSKIDKAVKRGVLHPNAGARRKSRLARAKARSQAAAS